MSAALVTAETEASSPAPPAPSPAELQEQTPSPTQEGRPPPPPRVPGAPVRPRVSKRFRPPGPPFHEKLYSQTGRLFRARLEVPAEDEECPLTLGPIAEDSLDFLREETTYFTAFPEVKKIVLPCGHAFGALSCLYHFARHNMLCPCCRAGVDAKLSLQCVPAHFKQTFTEKVHQQAREDTREAIREDAEAAQSLAGLGSMVLSVRLVDFISSGVTMAVDFYGAEDQHPRSSMIIPLAPDNNARRAIFEARNSSRNHDQSLAFTVPQGHIRGILEHQIRDNSVDRVRLSVLVETPDEPGGTTIVSITEAISLDRRANETIRNLDAGHGSCFFIRTTQGDTRIEDFNWHTPENYALLIS